MRFRSLFVDYKAEALQILRDEEDEENRRTQQSGVADTEKVIRIRSSSLDNDDEADSAGNADDTQTQDWKNSETPRVSTSTRSSGSPLVSNPNQNANDIDVAIAKPVVVTPMSSNKTDGSKKCEDGSLGTLGCKDCDVMDEARPEGKDKAFSNPTKVIDSRIVLLGSPWLLALVSCIRRRANRRRIAHQAHWEEDDMTNDYRCNYQITDRPWPNDSFSKWWYLYPRILCRATNQCWIRNSWKAGWKRLQALSPTDSHSKNSRGIHHGRNNSCKTSMESFPLLSSVIHDRRGDFASPSRCRTTLRIQGNRQESDALVVFRGDATDGGSNGNDGDDRKHPHHHEQQQQQVLASRELWETAIMTAATLCAYQQQQQQQQKIEHMRPQAIAHKNILQDKREGENREESHRPPSCLPTGESRTSSNDDPPASAVEHKYIDGLEDRRQQQQEYDRRQQEPLLTSNEEDAVSEIRSPRSENFVGRNEKKRSLSQLPEEENEFVPPTRKRPREEEPSVSNYDQGTNARKGFSEISRSDADARETCGSKQKESSSRNPSEGRLEFLLQRFGLLSKLKNRNDDELAMTTPTKSGGETDSDADSAPQNVNPEDHEVRDIANNGLPKKPDLKCTSVDEADYSSPIEFPVCLDYYDDEEDEDDGGSYPFAETIEPNIDRLAESNTNSNGGPSTLQDGDGRTRIEIDDRNERLPEMIDSEGPVLAKETDYSSPVEFPTWSDAYEEEEEQEDLEGTPIVVKTEPCASPTMNSKYATSQSLQNKSKRKKRRRRTSQKKRLRKNEKRRRKEKKKKNPTPEIDLEANDANEEDEDGDRLETPRKLDFKSFSPVKAMENESESQGVANMSTQSFYTPKATRSAGNDAHETEGEELETPRKLVTKDFSSVKPKETRIDSRGVTNQSIRSKKRFHSPPNKYYRNTEASKSPLVEAVSSVSSTEDAVASDDPFSYSPEEILETINCADPVAQDPKQQEEDEKAPLRVLCSEAFFETFGDVIAEIVRSGGGNRESFSERSIRFTDTDLCDACAVDIEIPCKGAVVVSTLSQIQKSGGIMVAFLPRMVELAASHRYDRLVVFVCVDGEVDAAAARDLVRLQTAFLNCARGLPRTETSVQLCSRRSLGACLTKTILGFASPHSISSSWKVDDHWLSDPRACQRLKFLLCILPTLSVTGALRWLDVCIGRSGSSPGVEEAEDPSLEWFQRCFQNVDDECRKLESHLQQLRSKKTRAKLVNFMNPSVPKQLVRVVNVRLPQY